MLAWEISYIAGSADDDTFDEAAFEEDEEFVEEGEPRRRPCHPRREDQD